MFDEKRNVQSDGGGEAVGQGETSDAERPTVRASSPAPRRPNQIPFDDELAEDDLMSLLSEPTAEERPKHRSVNAVVGKVGASGSERPVAYSHWDEVEAVEALAMHWIRTIINIDVDAAISGRYGGWRERSRASECLKAFVDAGLLTRHDVDGLFEKMRSKMNLPPIAKWKQIDWHGIAEETNRDDAAYLEFLNSQDVD